jgi:lambda family phage portal protein
MLDQETLDMIGDLPTPAVEVVPGKALALVGGAFEGAATFDKDLALWQPGLASADFDLIPDKPYVDARVRDSIRNDSYVHAGAKIHQDAIVGAHFILNSKPNLEVLGLDSTWADEFQKEVEAKFQLWADSIENWVDKTRLMNFNQLIRLGVSQMVSSGEMLGAIEWMKDGRPYQTAFQFVDTDRLSNPWGQFNNPKLRMGVEKNDDGVPIAYHIRKAHPADFTNFASFNAFQWDRIEAREKWGRTKILHIADRWRVDQSRGMSAMVTALKEMRMTKRYRDVVLQNAVVNATYAATIESDLPSETVMAQIGGGNVGEVAAQNAVTTFATGFLGAIAEYGKGTKNMAIDGVKIPHLFPGTTLKMQPAGGSDAMGTNFEQSLLRYLAATLDVSYEQLSRDYSDVNYSSFRAAANETKKTMQAKKKNWADRLASAGFFRPWLEEAINAGDITSMSKACPSIYTNGKLGLIFDAYSSCDWIGGSQGQIDELKETQAAIQRIIFGLSTYEDEHARLGKDFRKVFAQIERERKELKDRDILQNVEGDMLNATTGGLGEQDSGQKASGFKSGSKGSK